MNDIPQAAEHDAFGILPPDANATPTEPPQGSPDTSVSQSPPDTRVWQSPLDTRVWQSPPDTSALIEEIGRLARLVGFLKAENERLEAERHDFHLQLEQLQNQKAREEAAGRARR